MSLSACDRRSFIAVGIGAACGATLGTRTVWAEEDGELSSATRGKATDLDRLLWALPLDTESVLVSRGQLPVEGICVTLLPPKAPSASTYGQPAESGGAGSGRMLSPMERNEFPNGITELACGTFLRSLRHLRDPAHAVSVLREFFANRLKMVLIGVRNTNYAGYPQCQRCNFVVFRAAVAGKLMRTWQAFAVQRHLLETHSVLEFQTPATVQGNPPFREYLTSLWPDTALTANSLDILNAVLERIAAQPKRCALPQSLPERKYVNVESAAWCVRHYSPFPWQGDPFSMRQHDERAIGLVACAEHDPPREVVLRYLSSAADAESRFLQMIKTARGTHAAAYYKPMRRTTSCCVEARFVVKPLAGPKPEPLVIPPGQGTFDVWANWAPLFGLFEKEPGSGLL